MATVRGCMLLGGAAIKGEGEAFAGFDPVQNRIIEPSFRTTSLAQLNQAVALAAAAFPQFAESSAAERAALLDQIAAELNLLRDPLLQRAQAETGLPEARLQGELARTTGQLQLFAATLRAGTWQRTRHEPALPERLPLPRPELRTGWLPLGPVAVFGASNFPLAFSVAGGDTAAALAAGCPVVVKGHPAHPGTSELAGLAIQRALHSCSLPQGIFALLQGEGNELGSALVRHPQICAVAFTGSLAGGRALFDLAATRPNPIPVFAEMGSVNPMFLLPGAVEAGVEPLAQGYVDSVSLGVGQFCTKPGLLFILRNQRSEQFLQQAAAAVSGKTPATMLHPRIKANYMAGLARLEKTVGVEPVGELPADTHSGCAVRPRLLHTDYQTYHSHEFLADEVFGPLSLVVECGSNAEMRLAAQGLRGQLTATVHAAPAELEQARELFAILKHKAGRLLFGGFPTGVEVGHAMVHGGPYPASTDSRSTSVGTLSIERFLRPVCCQGFPADLLPRELRV